MNLIRMSGIPLWFERKFDFTFPVEQFPNLCVRLRGTPGRLQEIVRGVSSKALTANPGEGKWSAQEHAGHLLDLEPLWAARVEDFLGGGDALTVADLSNRKTHAANHNAGDIEEITAGFRAARMALLDRVSKLASEAFARTLLHPRLKQPMRLIDHLFFVAEHDDHHLATIWELLK